MSSSLHKSVLGSSHRVSASSRQENETGSLLPQGFSYHCGEQPARTNRAKENKNGSSRFIKHLKVDWHDLYSYTNTVSEDA